MESIKIINCHTHLFNRNAVPDKFLPRWLRPVANMLEHKGTFEFLYHVFGAMQRHELALLVKKYHAFLNVGDLKSQLETFKYLQSFYPEGTRFCVLPMDMEFMQAGAVKQPYLEQLEELAAIKQDPAYRDLIYPFIFVHPERKGMLDIVKRYIEEKGFSGLKLYPPLGYYPFDERLNEIYAYAEKYRLPITTHCARGGVFYKGEITGDMLIHPKTGQHIKLQKNKFFTDIYTDPGNYEYVLQQFPNLKINLAHFGGCDEWQKYLDTSLENTGATWFEKICALIRKYQSVYADISYTMFSEDLFSLFKLSLEDETLRSKILYGSDFYMVEQQTGERQFLTNVRGFIGEENFRLIAERNPTLFLSAY
jgi:predicted TIM-barrel fold metal-dependent hydrolase